MPAFGPCRRPAVAQACFFCRRTPLSCLSSPHCSLPRLSFRLPSFFPSSVFLPVFRFSSRLPFFSCRPAFPTARVSLCPCLPLSVFLSARSSPALSVRPQSSVFRLVFLLSFLVFPFIVHRLPLVVRRPLRRPSSSACRLLSVARCPSLAARCLSPVAPSIVHRPPLVGGCPYPVPRRAAPLSAAVRSGSRLLYPRNPGLRVFGSCLPCRVPSVGLSAKMPPPPYLGRRAVSDKITPCILLSGAIFPARPAILLTIWQRLPFGTTFVQIQGVTGAPDPQGGRIPAARKENGKNINN